MNQSEHLDRILAKCRVKIAIFEALTAGSAYLDYRDQRHAIAGWRSTIAAIEGLRHIGFADGHIAQTICDLWPEELL